MSELEKQKAAEAKMIMPGLYPPYYPDEDRQLAAELMSLAGQLMDIASRVIKPDHYWYKEPLDPPEIYPMEDKAQ
jgi:hypothetical protein